MTKCRWSSVLGAVTGLLVALALVGGAHAAPLSKCNAAKKKCIGKYVAAVLACHAKAEHDGVAVDGGCVAKAVAKVTGGGKGCFDKLDAKMPNDCATTGDAGAQLGAADGLVADVVSAVDPSYPTPTLTRCGAARKKCAGKKASGLMSCAAKANKTGSDDLACLARIRDKFAGAKGCDVRALAKGPDCLGTTSTQSLETTIDTWQLAAADDLDATTHCGNGTVEPGEGCDASAPGAELCAGGLACNSDCTCPCPSSVHLVAAATDAASLLDEGWTGMAHRMPISSGADLTLAVSGCGDHCACAVSGPLPNVGAAELRNRRCTNDTSIRCTDDTPCLGAGGTCEAYAGPPLPVSAGGIGACNVSRWVGPISGTLNVSAGAIAYAASAHTDVFFGPPDNPCIKCDGDPTMNDDALGGTCVGGPRNGLACDANGEVPGRPDFGATSLDCPKNPADFRQSMVTDASAASAAVTKTLTAASPFCGDGSGNRCLCETCNNAAAEPCSSNADCPDSPGPLPGICGGKRCVGGGNDGSGCVAASECPGGLCGRAGEPTKPSSCLDDTDLVDCMDTAPLDGEGECVAGPVTKMCSAPHAQRPCGNDADCTPGTCVAGGRKCFLTGGLPSIPDGTTTLIAEGAASPPVGDVAAPTLGSVYCVPPARSAVIEVTRGFPGPARRTAKTTMTFRP